MLWEKAKKWSELQHREGNTKFPIPYEIHITVNKNSDFEKFKLACEKLGVKALAIDLYSKSGEIILDEVMTSCKFIGDNQTAYKKLCDTTNGLIAHGFHIIRQKIETVPWHPAAPSANNSIRDMRNKYFESHIELMCSEKNLAEIQKFFEEGKEDLHISINTAKPAETDGTRPVLVTYRDYNGVYEAFREHTKTLYDLLSMRASLYGWHSVQKPVIEFSLYDTNITHDDSWIKEKV
jgi:hypothetical protein